MNKGLRVRLGWLRRYSFSKDEFSECRGNIVRHNAWSLGVAALLEGFAIIVLSIYPRKFGEGIFSRGTLLENPLPFIAAFIEFGIYITLNAVKKKHVDKSVLVNALAALSVICVLLVVFDVLLLNDTWVYAERFVVLFFSFQIIFVYDFLAVFITNASVLLLLLIFEIRFSGGAALWYLDIANAACASVISMVFTWVAGRRQLTAMLSTRSLEAERNRFHEESIHDPLTGLGNRRNFEQSVDFYTSVCRHVHQTVCVIMLDIDYFKSYNDFYGHPKGDEVLRAIGQTLKDIAETERVFAARVGGEEFIVLWTENRVAEAERVARKLWQNIFELKIPHERSDVSPYITASLGLYIMRGGSQDDSGHLYKSADIALYRAKESGRNCIVLLDSADGSFREVQPVPPDLNIGRI